MSNKSQLKQRLLFCVPLPPPLAGPEISSQILLESPLKDQFEIICLRTNVHKENAQRGTVTAGSIFKLFGLIARLKWMMITKNPSCVYTILNQNVTGFIRDSMIVLVAKSFGKKVVLHFRGSNFEYFYKKRGRVFQAYIRFVLRRVDKIILQATWLVEKFSRFVPKERLVVIYNPVPDGLLREAHKPRGEREEGAIRVLFMNHLSVAKGIVELLAAAKEIVLERKDITFLIAGDVINNEKNIYHGEDGQEIQFQDVPKLIKGIQENPKYSQIQFLGLIKDGQEKFNLYCNADIFVLPSYSEGCPVSVMEALAFGLPVIVTRVGALVDIIRDDVNGLFVQIGQAKHIKQAILELAEDPAKRCVLSESNRKLIQSRFTVGHIIEGLKKVFEGL